MLIDELSTPAAIIDADAFEANLATMSAVHPGARLRPHVKAHKSTAIAARQAAAGHRTFTVATPREALGLAAAGLGDDILIANEVVDPRRLAAVAALGAADHPHHANITVAVDSEATIDAAADAGVVACVIDVNVGLPRCGCDPGDAGRLASIARGRGLNVSGVLPFAQALFIVGTIVSVHATHAVADVGLKALGMDHGNPTMVNGDVWCFSDEHVTFTPADGATVGSRVRVIPAHVDPTMATHEAAWLVRGDEVLGQWAVDLRGWD